MHSRTCVYAPTEFSAVIWQALRFIVITFQPCPCRIACFQRVARRMPVSCQSWSVHLFQGRTRGHLQVESGRWPNDSSMWLWRIGFEVIPRRVTRPNIDRHRPNIVSARGGNPEQERTVSLVMCLYQQIPRMLQRMLYGRPLSISGQMLSEFMFRRHREEWTGQAYGEFWFWTLQGPVNGSAKEVRGIWGKYTALSRARGHLEAGREIFSDTYACVGVLV